MTAPPAMRLNVKQTAKMMGKGIVNISRSYKYEIENMVFTNQLITLMDLVIDFDFEIGTIIFVLEHFERRLNILGTMNTKLYTTLHPIIEIALACVIVGSKYCQDLAIWNADFLDMLPSNQLNGATITIQQLNQLERFHLKALDFRVDLPFKNPEKRLCVILKFLSQEHNTKIERELQFYKHVVGSSPCFIQKALFLNFKDSQTGRKPNKLLTNKSKDDFYHQPSIHLKEKLSFFAHQRLPDRAQEEIARTNTLEY